MKTFFWLLYFLESLLWRVSSVAAKQRRRFLPHALIYPFRIFKLCKSDVGLHQGSALSPYLFLILMDVLTEGVRKEVPESMMFADDIVLCGGREVDMTEYLDTWRKSLEERGMRVSRPKTQFMHFNFQQSQQGNREPVKILGEELERVTRFKYLGTSMEEEGQVVWKLRSQSGWKQAGEIGRNAAEYCATEGCQWNWRGRYTKQWSGQQCYMGQKRGLQRRDKKNGLRWPRRGCYDGCAEWHARTRSGMNTSEEQREGRRLPQRSPREDWTGTGMWWGEKMANTYWGKCWGRIYQGKGREDDRKQDGKTRVTYWSESGRGDRQGDVEKKDHQLYRRPYMMGKARGKVSTGV